MHISLLPCNETGKSHRRTHGFFNPDRLASCELCHLLYIWEIKLSLFWFIGWGEDVFSPWFPQ